MRLEAGEPDGERPDRWWRLHLWIDYWIHLRPNGGRQATQLLVVVLALEGIGVIVLIATGNLTR